MNQLFLFARVDPQTWMFVSPILIVLLLIYLGPTDMWIKQLCKDMILHRTTLFNAIKSQDDLFERRERIERSSPWVFWGMYLMLLVGTIHNYLVWLEVIPN